VKGLNRQQYLAELRTHLAGLPQNEIEMAVKFYDEYFDEANDDEAVAEELGKPFHLAKSIISEQSAYSRSVIYMQYKQNRPPQTEQKSVFADIKQTAYAPDGEIYPNIKTVDSVSLQKKPPESGLPAGEKISKRAFILGMTAIICGTVVCTLGILFAGIMAGAF
jgi:hypothetical protein